MPKKRHTPEQIINKLREAEALLSKGIKIPEVCRRLEVTEQTYYHWRKEHGDRSRLQARTLRRGDLGPHTKESGPVSLGASGRAVSQRRPGHDLTPTNRSRDRTRPRSRMVADGIPCAKVRKVMTRSSAGCRTARDPRGEETDEKDDEGQEETESGGSCREDHGTRA